MNVIYGVFAVVPARYEGFEETLVGIGRSLEECTDISNRWTGPFESFFAMPLTYGQVMDYSDVAKRTYIGRTQGV
jgi:hypothetical protein